MTSEQERQMTDEQKRNIQATGTSQTLTQVQISRYHLDFSAPAARFEASRGLFKEMAELFTYLTSSL